MDPLRVVFDLSLVACLVALAIGSLLSSSIRKCIVLFMTFGLVMAFAWARLGAADIALVEAAVGSGLTGALLMSAAGGMSQPKPRADESGTPEEPR